MKIACVAEALIDEILIEGAPLGEEWPPSMPPGEMFLCGFCMSFH